MRVAIVPARGGSKRIPRKNIRPFLGIPIIGRVIETALECDFIDQVIVSTDDPAIAQVAEDFGARVPFLRPTHLADDYAPTLPVVQHALGELAASGQEISHACCIYPSAVGVTAADLTRGYETMADDVASRLSVSVVKYVYPIQRALVLGSGGELRMLHPEHARTRSQDLRESWHDAGQFYWGSSQAWIVAEDMLIDSLPVSLPTWQVQDIDTEEDWARAEALFQLRQRESMPPM